MNSELQKIQNILNTTIFGSAFKDLINSDLFNQSVPNYPPANIYRTKLEDGEILHTIELGVTGFKKDWLTIELDSHNNLLLVKGESPKEEKQEEEREYIVNKLAKRNFIIRFNVADFTEVTKVNLDDGLLSIQLKVNKPENVKPQKIEIL